MLHFLILAYLLLVSSGERTNDDRYYCPDASDNPGDRRADLNRLTVGTFNAEWLFDGYGSETSSSPWKTPEEADAHAQRVAEVIDDLGVDVLNMVEVEDCYILEVVKGYMTTGDDFAPYVVKGEDSSTGQNVGMLTKVDPLSDLARSEERVSYPLQGSTCGFCGEERDTGTSKHYYTHLESNGVKILMIGVHFISQINGERACSQREAQATVIQNIIQEHRLENEEVIVLGDFNDWSDIMPGTGADEESSIQSNVLRIVRESLEAECVAMYNSGNELPQEERFTTLYNGEGSNIDHILLSEGLRPYIESVRYATDAFEHDAGVSDHWPVLVTFNFAQDTSSYTHCPSACVNGICNRYNGGCMCHGGWTGEDCSESTTDCPGYVVTYVPEPALDPSSMSKTDLQQACHDRQFDVTWESSDDMSAALVSSYTSSVSSMSKADKQTECGVRDLENKGESGDLQTLLLDSYVAALNGMLSTEVQQECVDVRLEQRMSVDKIRTELEASYSSRVGGMTSSELIEECAAYGLDCDSGYTNAQRRTLLEDNYGTAVLDPLSDAGMRDLCEAEHCICSRYTKSALQSELSADKETTLDSSSIETLREECVAESCICGNSALTSDDLGTRLTDDYTAEVNGYDRSALEGTCDASWCICITHLSDTEELRAVVQGDVDAEVEDSTEWSYCSNHGTCLEGLECFCDFGYSGPDCTFSTTELFDEEIVDGATCPDSYDAFDIWLKAGSTLTLTIEGHPMSASPMADVTVRANGAIVHSSELNSDSREVVVYTSEAATPVLLAIFGLGAGGYSVHTHISHCDGEFALTEFIVSDYVGALSIPSSRVYNAEFIVNDDGSLDVSFSIMPDESDGQPNAEQLQVDLLSRTDDSNLGAYPTVAETISGGKTTEDESTSNSSIVLVAGAAAGGGFVAVAVLGLVWRRRRSAAASQRGVPGGDVEANASCVKSSEHDRTKLRDDVA
eukprot:Rmarinus@m.13826